eukprot:256465-Lingulodinium_polyedra.AAC.1
MAWKICSLKVFSMGIVATPSSATASSAAALSCCCSGASIPHPDQAQALERAAPRSPRLRRLRPAYHL